MGWERRRASLLLAFIVALLSSKAAKSSSQGEVLCFPALHLSKKGAVGEPELRWHCTGISSP
jgi:hypothetical protein